MQYGAYAFGASALGGGQVSSQLPQQVAGVLTILIAAAAIIDTIFIVPAAVVDTIGITEATTLTDVMIKD